MVKGREREGRRGRRRMGERERRGEREGEEEAEERDIKGAYPLLRLPTV